MNPQKHVRPLVTGALGLLTALGAMQACADGASPAAGAPGRIVYEKWCAPCHAPGIVHPGTHALMSKYPNSSRASGVITEWTDLKPSYVRFMVRHGMSVMPQFRKTEISDAELNDLAAYVSRNTPPEH